MKNLLGSIFSGDGEMARLMAAFDWSSTPLGPAEAWPQSLRTSLGLILGSLHPIFCRELWSRGHEVPEGILPAYGAREALAELQAQGAVGKPFDPDALVASIRRPMAAATGERA